MGVPLTIQELQGESPLTVTLNSQQRSLPKETGLPYRASQRKELTYYPGNPSATVQVLGGKQDPIEIEGRFDDRWMSQNAGLDEVGTAAEMVEKLDQMRENGHRCQLTWGPLTLYGLIDEFVFTFLRVEIVDYKLTFCPTGDPEDLQTILAVAATPDLASRSQQVKQSLLDVATAALDDATNVAQSFLDGVNDAVNRVAVRGAAFTAAVNSLAQVTEDYASSASRISSLLGSVQTEAVGLVNSLRSSTATARLAVSDAISVFRLEQYTHDLTDAGRTLAFQSLQLAEDLGPTKVDTLRVHTCKQGETLQQISTLYFGTPYHWQDIAMANDLSDTNLVAGQVLMIPDEAARSQKA